MCLTKIAGMCVSALLTNGGFMNVDLPKTTQDYNGKTHNIERFYTPESRPFNIGGVIAVDNTIIQLNYNSGIDAKKLDVNSSTDIQVTQRFNITDNVSIDTTIGTTIGGEVRHTACTDSVGAQYFCGNLTPWSEFNTEDHDQPYNGSIKINYRF